MSRCNVFIFLISVMIARCTDALIDSSLLSYYDLKVANSESTCRLVNHANLPDDRRTLAGRDCMCDEECIIYKDCCKDSRYYRPSEQSQPPTHHCGETTGVYTIAACSPDWKDSKTAQNCQRSIEPLESDDLSLILPVANQKTRKVYGNHYCAACNNDLDYDSWMQFPMGVACGEAPSGFLKYDPSYSYKESTNKNSLVDQNNQEVYGLPETNVGTHSGHITNNVITRPYPGFILDIHLYVTNDTVIRSSSNIVQHPIQLQTVVPAEWGNSLYTYERRKRQSANEIDFQRYSAQAEKICSTAKYDMYNKEFISQYNNKYFICRFGALLPEDSANFTRRCVPFLERQCPDDFKDETIKEECAIHTKIVYNKTSNKPYRNKDCARCNGEKEDAVDGKPKDTRTDLSSTPASSDKSSGGSGEQNEFLPSRKRK